MRDPVNPNQTLTYHQLEEKIRGLQQQNLLLHRELSEEAVARVLLAEKHLTLKYQHLASLVLLLVTWCLLLFFLLKQP